MDVFTVTSPEGKTANVSGTVYLNGKPIVSLDYDAILWCVMEGDETAVYQNEFENKKVLVIVEGDFFKSLLLQEIN
jgi:hypothetical protein